MNLTKFIHSFISFNLLLQSLSSAYFTFYSNTTPDKQCITFTDRPLHLITSQTRYINRKYKNIIQFNLIENKKGETKKYMILYR